MLLRRPAFNATLACLIALFAAHSFWAADDAAADPLTDPQGLASFTRAIQPLLLNRCATGACHGGPQAVGPQLTRGPTRGRMDRPTTLANLQQLSDAVAHKGGDQQFLLAVLQGHPPETLPGRPAAGLLSVRERQLLATWLAAFTQPSASRLTDSDKKAVAQRLTPAGFDRPAGRPPLTPQPAGALAPRPPAAGTPTTDRPNRFRQLLEQATNPPQLPPPRITKGLQLDQILPEQFPPLPPATDSASE